MDRSSRDDWPPVPVPLRLFSGWITDGIPHEKSWAKAVWSTPAQGCTRAAVLPEDSEALEEAVAAVSLLTDVPGDTVREVLRGLIDVAKPAPRKKRHAAD